MKLHKYKKYTVLWKLVALVIIMTYGASPMLAQQPEREIKEDFTEDELEAFVDAYEEVLEIQKESQEKMKESIEEENLSLERFNEILTAQQDPSAEVGASAEEMAAFNNAAQTIIEERKQIETKIVATIEEQGIDLNTYRDIMLAYQYSPKVKTRLDVMLEDQ